MGASDIERLKELKNRLAANVIGQDDAVEAVSRAIRRNRAGFDDGNRPIGSFLFVGPTGVGKTELAKQLALDLFGNKDAIIRLDMSEYSDRTAVSKLIGTTAGYVGYDDNSHTLTERVRRNPYSIVLLDEIEKADPQVITLLLQVLDDGHLTDGQGNQVNFKIPLLSRLLMLVLVMECQKLKKIKTSWTASPHSSVQNSSTVSTQLSNSSTWIKMISKPL